MICKNPKFSLFEQLWMQFSFHGIWIIGAVAIYESSFFLALLYVIIFPVVGIFFGVMRYWICPRCPHINNHHACIQAPPHLTRRIIKKPNNKMLKPTEKLGAYSTLYGLGIVPVYWVLQSDILIAIPYFVLVGMHYSAYLILCKKCLNVNCPQNINK